MGLYYLHREGHHCESAVAENKLMRSKFVQTLVKPLCGKGYCINMDNFFGFPQLFNKPSANSTNPVGAIGANRKGVSKDLTKLKLKKGEVTAMYGGRLMVLKWKDKKDVHMISTYHDVSTKEIGCQSTRKVKPVVCCDYNDSMDGVDLSDCFLSSYPNARERLKTYHRKQSRHVLDMTLLNGYILYKKKLR